MAREVKDKVIVTDVQGGAGVYIKVYDKTGVTTFNAWPTARGRWYGHEKRGGRKINDFSYASRRSARRAIRTWIQARWPDAVWS